MNDVPRCLHPKCPAPATWTHFPALRVPGEPQNPLSVGHRVSSDKNTFPHPLSRAGLHPANPICQSSAQTPFFWKGEPDSPKTELHSSAIVH